MDYDWVVLWVGILLLTLIIVGAGMVYPITRKLADLIDWYLQEKKEVGAGGEGRDPEMMDALAALERRVELVTERQRFLETLIEDRGLLDSGAPGRVERLPSRPASDPSQGGLRHLRADVPLSEPGRGTGGE